MYIIQGVTRSHFYGYGLPTLSWKQSLNVCIEASRGRHFLHTSYVTPVIHHDVKSVNILLDGNLNAIVVYFGISRIGPNEDQTRVSTVVKDTVGYRDSRYSMREKFMEKSDVNSFGVVLIEKLYVSPVIDPILLSDEINC
ncbi:receptor-like protein kinase HERK 1 [Vicia villosa]|uniref:receptor-like protein kinase HERK 1 n=1 Tax=Vicia villosa TaxID=3911 RepID=UPI00273CE746|nr:receptor-like protein kinase HERK 1 [Vicia villosa]